jgi:hypothetical protein
MKRCREALAPDGSSISIWHVEICNENVRFPPSDIVLGAVCTICGRKTRCLGLNGERGERCVRASQLIQGAGRIRRDKYGRGIEGSGGSWIEGPMYQSQCSKLRPTLKWLKSLLDVEMSCGIVSYGPRSSRHFTRGSRTSRRYTDKRVSASSGYKRDNRKC